jgi:transposase InsO family protein
VEDSVTETASNTSNGSEEVQRGRAQAVALFRDALHGRQIGGRKVYLFAFLDDHSRLLVGYRFGFSEDTVRLGVALHRALAARGVPQSVHVDNGSAFVDAWLLRACAKLAVRLVHSTTPTPLHRLIHKAVGHRNTPQA